MAETTLPTLRFEGGVDAAAAEQLIRMLSEAAKRGRIEGVVILITTLRPAGDGNVGIATLVGDMWRRPMSEHLQSLVLEDMGASLAKLCDGRATPATDS